MTTRKVYNDVIDMTTRQVNNDVIDKIIQLLHHLDRIEAINKTTKGSLLDGSYIEEMQDDMKNLLTVALQERDEYN